MNKLSVIVHGQEGHLNSHCYIDRFNLCFIVLDLQLSLLSFLKIYYYYNSPWLKAGVDTRLLNQLLFVNITLRRIIALRYYDIRSGITRTTRCGIIRCHYTRLPSSH